MTTTGHEGAATRQASAGTKPTSAADRTRPAAPACAIQPIAAARWVEIADAGTTAIPAICAMLISGMARKFSASPANVTRENSSAPIGSSIASTAADATNIATHGRITTLNAAAFASKAAALIVVTTAG